MPRIEIELTSARSDGTWTWRAAGARQPKGTLDAAVLPGGAKVGDVLRAEADIDIDGITVRSTAAVTGKKSAPERIEIIGSGREEPPVTTNMRGGVEAGGERERGRRGDRDRDRDRFARPGGRGPGGPGSPGGPGGARPADRNRRDAPRPDSRPGGGDGGRPAGDAGRPPRGDRPAGTHPGGGRPAGARPASGERPPRLEHPGDRTERPPRREHTGERRERPARPARPAEAPRPKAKKLQPGRTYRDAVLAELSPDRKVVAEQILRGGIPAVRQAVEEQNAKAREVGGPEIKADALLAVAEELLPALRAAEWRDRAEAAVVIVDEISVRDLRAVVSGADTARDEEGRALAAHLREALERRSAEERQSWVDEITSSLDDGRVVRALRISGRPPEPGTRFPAELAKRLSDAGGEALGPDTTPDRWAAVLEAVVGSPVRRTITPRGLPTEPGEALTKALHLAAPRVPAIGALLGETPGAPPRRPGAKLTPSRGGPPGRGAGRPPAPRTPPPPPPVAGAPAAGGHGVTEAGAPPAQRADAAGPAPDPIESPAAAPAAPEVTAEGADAPAAPEPGPDEVAAAIPSSLEATGEPEPGPDEVAAAIPSSLEATGEPEPAAAVPDEPAGAGPSEPVSSAPVVDDFPEPVSVSDSPAEPA